MKFIYIWVVGLFVIGCSNSVDSLWKEHEQKADYRAKLLKTQKAILYDEDGNKAYITATYINGFDAQDKDLEKFVVSLYIEDSDDYMGLDKDYYLRLGDKKPLKIKKLDKNDKLLKDISFKTEWKNYYLVEFTHVKSDKLYLIFGHKGSSEVKLYFAKKAKYNL
jgi:hypothetical protein